MGCRDCNSALETCQNSVAELTEKSARAGQLILAVGGILDEFEDEVRTIRGTTSAEAIEKLSAVATSALQSIHDRLEQWMLSEEEARG